MYRRSLRLQLALVALFGLLTFNLADSTARYLASYYLATSYPLGTVAKPIVLLGATTLLGLFALWAREEACGVILGVRTLEGVVVLSLATGILFVDMKVLAALGVALPHVITDASWFALYATALVAFPVFLAIRVGRHIGWTAAVVPLLLAGAFLTKLLDHLYLWVQSVFGTALPYPLAFVGMFGPAVGMSAAGLTALGVHLRHNPIRIPSRGLLGLLAVPLLPAVPAMIQALLSPLPSLIVRGWAFWSLGYAGYGWYTPSVLAAGLGAYLFLLSRLRSRGEPGRLLFWAVLIFPLSGIFVLFLDYSSIPGNLLGITAAAVALDVMRRGNAP